MSKKHKKLETGNPSVMQLSHQEEYRIIKHDLAKVIVLNVLYLAGILGIYYSNVKAHYLERWFEKLVKF